jgi:hypothetical protein
MISTRLIASSDDQGYVAELVQVRFRPEIMTNEPADVVHMPALIKADGTPNTVRARVVRTGHAAAPEAVARQAAPKKD